MIELVKVEGRILGNIKAHDILGEIVDNQTLLVLSGGTSPDYDKIIVQPGDILPGAVCIEDERYGQPYHQESNELRIKNFGINDFLSVKGIEYHRILIGEDPSKTAQEFNKKVVDLFGRFKKKVGIMGVGADLHTSAIFPNSPAVTSSDYAVSQTISDRYPNRITLTIKALEQFTSFVILMFGSEKREALEKIMDKRENDINKFPAIFYRTSLIRSYLITDIEL